MTIQKTIHRVLLAMALVACTLGNSGCATLAESKVGQGLIVGGIVATIPVSLMALQFSNSMAAIHATEDKEKAEQQLIAQVKAGNPLAIEYCLGNRGVYCWVKKQLAEQVVTALQGQPHLSAHNTFLLFQAHELLADATPWRTDRREHLEAALTIAQGSTLWDYINEEVPKRCAENPDQSCTSRHTLVWIVERLIPEAMLYGHIDQAEIANNPDLPFTCDWQPYQPLITTQRLFTDQKWRTQELACSEMEKQWNKWQEQQAYKVKIKADDREAIEGCLMGSFSCSDRQLAAQKELAWQARRNGERTPRETTLLFLAHAQLAENTTVPNLERQGHYQTAIALGSTVEIWDYAKELGRQNCTTKSCQESYSAARYTRYLRSIAEDLLKDLQIFQHQEKVAASGDSTLPLECKWGPYRDIIINGHLFWGLLGKKIACGQVKTKWKHQQQSILKEQVFKAE